MITFGICIYLIGVLLAWVLCTGFWFAWYPGLSNAYKSIDEFYLSWKSNFDNRYEFTYNQHKINYRRCRMFVLFSWFTVAIAFVDSIITVGIIEWFKTAHLFPRKFPSKEKVKLYYDKLANENGW